MVSCFSLRQIQSTLRENATTMDVESTSGIVYGVSENVVFSGEVTVPSDSEVTAVEIVETLTIAAEEGHLTDGQTVVILGPDITATGRTD